MARIRTIKPEFWSSESIGRLTRDARLLFIAMWSLADDSGRLRGGLPYLSGAVFPYDDDARQKIGGWIAELEKEGMVRRYVGTDGNSYIDIPKWSKHQKIDKPSPSKIPAFGEHSPSHPRTVAEASPLDQGSGTMDQGPWSMDQGAGTVERGPERASEPQPHDPFAEIEQTHARPAQVHSNPSANQCAIDLPIRLRDTWREIMATDGPAVANAALAAGRRLFRSPSPAQLLETWKCAATAGVLHEHPDRWPDFRQAMRADRQRERAPGSVQADAETLDLARQWDEQDRQAKKAST